MLKSTFKRSAVLAAALVGSSMSNAALADDETTLPSNTVAHRDVVYATRATGPVKLDIFTPPGDGPFALALWIHGGAWKMGDKAAWSHMNFLVGHGYAAANIGYRFSQVAKFPAQLDDVTAALDYLVAHADELKIDPARIAVTGESAGGHLASLLGMSRATSTTQPIGQVRAVIDLFGPTDLAAFPSPNSDGAIEQLMGGVSTDKPAAFRDASPLSHVDRGSPPFLVLHGTKDPLVPIDQSDRLVAALKAAGVPVEYVKVEGAGHAGPMFWTPQMQDTMLAFLGANLK